MALFLLHIWIYYHDIHEKIYALPFPKMALQQNNWIKCPSFIYFRKTVVDSKDAAMIKIFFFPFVSRLFQLLYVVFSSNLNSSFVGWYIGPTEHYVYCGFIPSSTSPT